MRLAKRSSNAATIYKTEYSGHVSVSLDRGSLTQTFFLPRVEQRQQQQQLTSRTTIATTFIIENVST